jgi:hypothetical protein
MWFLGNEIDGSNVFDHLLKSIHNARHPLWEMPAYKSFCRFEQQSRKFTFIKSDLKLAFSSILVDFFSPN